MPQKKYHVDLTGDERAELEQMLQSGKHNSRKLTRARILLLADAGKTDAGIAAALLTARPTVARTRQRFVEQGLGCLEEKSRQGALRASIGKTSGASGCRRVQRCSRRTRRLDAATFGGQGGRAWLCRFNSAGNRQADAQKNKLKPWLRKQWCIGTVTAEYVAAMEDVLDLYSEDYNEQSPVVCFDETSKQLVQELRPRLAAASGKLERFDYEYKRGGVANLLMICEPKSGWRHVEVTERHTKRDCAEQMKWLVETAFPEATKIRLVMDNLATHSRGAVYERFEPEEARRILRKLEFHFTPKHASWLNMAEIELSVLARQCLSRRIADKEKLKREVKAFEEKRNAAKAKIEWKMTTTDAREKLSRHYPSISE